MTSTLHRSFLAVAFATTGTVAFSGCGSESSVTPQGKSGSGGSSAGSAGRGGSAGGKATGGTTGKGGEAGSEGGEGGEATGTSGRGGSASGGRGGTSGKGGSGGGSAGRAGSSGSAGEGGGSAAQAGNGGVAGEATDGGAAGSQAGEGGTGPVPGCSTADDQCPVGSYCAVDGAQCVPGCKLDTDCASGRCNEQRDCDRCVSNAECAGGRVCGTGLCHDPCGDEPLFQCAQNVECCNGSCAETDYDINHCLGCGIVCSAGEFCGTDGCSDAAFVNVCKTRSVVVLIDDQPGDEAPARALGEALAASCSPSPPVAEVEEGSATVLNPLTGQPLVGGDLLAVAGGPFGQDVVRYLDAQRLTPIYPATATNGNFELRRSRDNALVTSFAPSTLSASHDYLTIEVARDSVTGVFAVIAYGFNEYGTAAAVWYFANVVLPDLTTREGTYYVLEWTDDGDLTPDAGDTFTLIQSDP